MQPDISIMRAHSSMASGSCIIRTPQQTHANLSRNSAPPVMPVFSSHPSSNIADQLAMSNNRLVLNETTRIDTDSEGDDTTTNNNHQVADEIDGGEEKIEGNTEIRRLLERRSQREQEQRKRRKSTGSITSETLIARKYRGDDDHLEIFDPSLIFISTFKCYYWDSKDRIRKGKVYITSRELMFKCSGMPFVKVRLDLSDITDVVKIKNYKHKLQNVLSIETNSSSSSSNTSTSKSFVFYKFRLPRNLVRSIIMQLVTQAKVTREQEEMLTGSQSDAESINSHILRLKKMSQPLNHFASLIRTSLNGYSSATTTSTTTPKSSHNPSEDENGSESTMLNREAETASSSTTLSTSEASTLQDEIDNNTKRTKKTLSFKSKKQRNSLKREYSRNDNTNTNTNKSTSSQEPVSSNGERNELRVANKPPNMPFQDSCTTMHHKLTTNENNSSIQLEYNKTVKNSTATVLLLMFLSLLIFFVIAVNNFIKLSTIERQIYHSLKWDGDAVLPGYL